VGRVKPPIALTIAGSDSGGGAGIQADLKTFAALGCHGTSAITAITVQNTLGVREAFDLPPELIRSQIDAVADDLPPRATKTGMLSSSAIIEAVAEAVRQRHLEPLVVDPVMVAKGGHRLLAEDAVASLRRRLLPLATVVTPNLPEAEVLLERPLGTREEREAAARDLVELAELYRSGRLRPHVSAVYPLADAAGALSAVAGRRSIGKVVIAPSR